jgi:hypothetical protein
MFAQPDSEVRRSARDACAYDREVRVAAGDDVAAARSIADARGAA